MSELVAFARKLMRINEKTVRSNTPTAIFGTIGDLPQSVSSRPPYRIGLWPCQSADKPEFAMGLWSALAYLLERWRDIQVYRLFVQFEADPDDFEWDISQSQFDVDDFTVEALDENIAVWGQFSQHDGVWQLAVFAENDLLAGQDSESEKFVVSAATPADFVYKLPDLAAQIASSIGAERLDDTDPVYAAGATLNETPLATLLSRTLEWDIKLLATLWDVDWDDDDVLADFQALLDSGKALNSDFAAWVVAKSVVHAMRPGYSVIGDLLADKAETIMRAFPNSPLPAPVLAAGVYNMGYANEGYNLLEAETEAHPASAAAWLKLAELYASGSRLDESIESFQSAIENEATSGSLYRAYGNVLLAADQYGEMVEDFVLIEPEDIEDDWLIWEAIEAYEKALEVDSGDTPALYSQVLQLAEVDEDLERFWDSFRRLLALDTSGDYIRDVVDGLYEVDDLTPGIEALQALLKENGERLDLYINLATLHLVGEAGDEAKPYLENAKTLTDNEGTLADIERLLLTADDPEFEQRFGEMAAILQAGNSLSTDDVDYLEEVSEKASHLIEAHLMLAQAYNAWDDSDAALEVLLDVQEKQADNPAVLDNLARILWDSGEKEVAFQYLNRGIQKYPFYVPLLVRTGRYLFDNDQLTEARVFLSRAEEVAPGSPSLQAVRAYIAQKMAENPDGRKDKS